MRPVELVLEWVRARQAADPFAMQRGRQEYVLRTDAGRFHTGVLDWEERLLDALAAYAAGTLDSEAQAWLGQRLQRLVSEGALARLEGAVEAALGGGPAVIVHLRLAAAELFALPWGLLTLPGRGLMLGRVPGVQLRLAWAGVRPVAPPPGFYQRTGRVLLACSSAGGTVPSAPHTELLVAHARGLEVFYPGEDVLLEASCAALGQALAAAWEEGWPYTALVLLCHGQPGSAGGGVLLDGTDGRPVRVDGPELAAALAPFVSCLRLVVLHACWGQSVGAPGNLVGGVALPLHRLGVETVLAPVGRQAKAASVELAERLWGGLLQRSQPLWAALGALGEVGPGGMVALSAASAEEEERPVPLRPYRGLLQFQQEDAPLFFGRGEDLDRLVNVVERQRASPWGLVVLVGASGVGKSSLLCAGLLPRLMAAEPRWRVCPLQLDGDPHAQVEQQLAELNTGTMPLWVIDPLDRLFNLDAKEQPAVAERILALAARGTGLVIGTLRPDLLARCADLALAGAVRLDAALYATGGLHFLALPTAEQLRACVEGPAARVGLALEPGLADRIVRDAGTAAGALALLQHTLDQLWTRRTGRVLTHGEYEAVGGLAGALVGSADRVMTLLGPRAEQAWGLLLGLVRVDEDGAFRRGSVPLRQLRPTDPVAAGGFDRVCAALVEARLVVRLLVDSQEHLELAHEVILRGWAELRGRAQAQRERLQAAGRLVAQALEWEAQGQDPDGLLRGRRLAVAEELAEQSWPQPPPAVLALLERSAAAERAAEQAQRAQLQERERLAAQVQAQATRARDAAILATARALREEDPTRALLVLREVGDRAQGAVWLREAYTLLASPVCMERVDPPRAAGVLAPHPVELGLWALAQGDEVWLQRAGVSVPDRVLRPGEGPVLGLCWSPAGRTLGVLTRAGASLWTAEGERRCYLLPGQPAPALLCLPGEDTALLCTPRQELLRCPVGAGTPRLLGALLGGVQLLRWSPDTHWVAVVAVGEPRTLRVWGAEPQVLRSEQPWVDVAFAPWGARLAAVTREQVCTCALPGGEPTWLPASAPLSAVGWSADGAQVLLGEEGGAVRPLAAGPGGLGRALLGPQEPVVGVWAEDTHHVQVVARSGVRSLWRVQADEAHSLPQQVAVCRGRITELLWHPQEPLLLVLTADGPPGLVDPEGRWAPLAVAEPGAARAVCWDSAGGGFFVGGARGTLERWDLGCRGGESPALAWRVETGLGAVEQLACAPEWGEVLAAGPTGRVLCVDAASGRALRTLDGHRAGLLVLAAGPGRQALWTASRDGTARRWEGDRCVLQVGEIAPLLEFGNPDRLRAACPDHEGGLWLGTEGGAVRRLGPDGQVSQTLQGQGASVRALAASATGARLAIGDAEGKVRVGALDRWDRAFSEAVDDTPVMGLRLDRSGASLQAWSRGGRVLVVLAGEGLSLLRPELPERCEVGALSPDGRWLAVGTEAGEVKLWPLDTAQVKRRLQSASRCVLSPADRELLLGEPRTL